MLRGHAEWDVPVLTCAGLTGEGLAEAYGDYLSRAERARPAAEIERLRLELEELRQERENAARSTGTMYSAGEGEVYDPAAAGWNSV